MKQSIVHCQTRKQTLLLAPARSNPPHVVRVHRIALPSRQLPIARAVIEPGSTPDTQRFVDVDAEVPIAAVQKLPESTQAAVVLGILAALAASTWAVVSFTDLEYSLTSYPGAAAFTGLTFCAAGVAHFKVHREFCSMMPNQGAWGLWYLPGSDSFHVNWTGVAEFAGGAGLLASCIPGVSEALPGLREAAALGLFALCVAVTPSNIFMFTHNAPGPGPKGTVIPATGHAFRGVMQVVLWTALWGLSHPPPV